DWGYRSGRPEGVDYEIKLSVQNKEPRKVTIKKAKSSGKKVQLSWNKDAGAEGYEVHRSIKKKSGFKKVADVKKTSYKDKKVKKKKTYYYKIRAYATSNGKKKYGKWSKTVKVKVK
ncbi:MAG: hypothetical protein IK121_05000, partial [Lachnospiraceae bacterium]|nr:hypothetical protein [Lachnospiraceae bacterium]